MPTEAEIKDKFWDAVVSDRTVMLRLAKEGDMPRPMTAQLEDDEPGPLWFFADRTDDLASSIGSGAAAELTFVDKGHDVFATVEGRLVQTDDRAMIDKLWSPFVEAWFPEGKTDPRLSLLRMDPGTATIWLAETGIVTGVKAMLGMDTQADYKDKVAHTRLD